MFYQTLFEKYYFKVRQDDVWAYVDEFVICSKCSETPGIIIVIIISASQRALRTNFSSHKWFSVVGITQVKMTYCHCHCNLYITSAIVLLLVFDDDVELSTVLDQHIQTSKVINYVLSLFFAYLRPIQVKNKGFITPLIFPRIF